MGDSLELCKNLSGGEQQKLGIARLLLAQPVFAFVDECTSECESEFEQWFFQYAQKQEITLITISHNSSLRSYHTHTLSLPDGKFIKNIDA